MSDTWVSMPELESLIGRDAAVTLCRIHGGAPIYVPQRLVLGSMLGRIIGPGPLRALAAVYGGCYITVPNGRSRDPLKPKIIAALEAGQSHRAIALELGVTERHVRAVAGQAWPRARQLTLW